MDPADLPATAYVWLKAIHIIAVIAWMAGLFYLPRLFAYHADAEPESVQSETFKVMERRLLGIIMNPAMVATWALGLALAWIGGSWTAPWFLTKLALVVVMTWFHFWLASCSRAFAADANRRPASTYRIINELPTILVIAIVILAVVKPF
jgi:putative membrane protein